MKALTKGARSHDFGVQVRASPLVRRGEGVYSFFFKAGGQPIYVRLGRPCVVLRGFGLPLARKAGCILIERKITTPPKLLYFVVNVE